MVAEARHPVAIVALKAVHTVIFAGELSAHASARLERDALLGENGVARQGLELGVRSSELVGDRLVFGFQDAAGRVYQPAAGLYEPRSRTQDGALLLRELGHCLVRVAPFEVGIAAQGAESTARRIDQNAVELPRQPLCPHVVIAPKGRSRGHW